MGTFESDESTSTFIVEPSAESKVLILALPQKSIVSEVTSSQVHVASSIKVSSNY